MDYIKETSDGVEITLAKGLIIEGATIKVLKMREPTVRDQETATKNKADPAEAEITMFANLTMQTPDDIRSLTLRDYKRLQVAFSGFID